MSIVELETRKAHLAREILNETDEGDEQYFIDDRKNLDKLLDRHLISLKDFKFNRDEANDYD
jgi:hypothetical protein